MGRNLILIVLAITVICILTNVFKSNSTNINEGFNEQAGRFCHTCAGKNFNQCSQCFNCGFCVDKWGNSGCIGGDHTGPYNFERCAYWYSGDPFAKMMQRNMDYKCSYGPSNASRAIGI